MSDDEVDEMFHADGGFGQLLFKLYTRIRDQRPQSRGTIAPKVVKAMLQAMLDKERWPSS